MTKAAKKKTRRVVLQTTTKPKRPPRKEPEYVIVELCGDGWVQIYAEDHIRFHVFNRLHSTDPARANDVDEFHALDDMSRQHRRLYFPRHLRATGQVEKRTVEAEYNRRENLKTLHEYQQLADDLKDGGKPK